MMYRLLAAAAALCAFALAPAQLPQPWRLDARAAIPFFVDAGVRVPGYLDSDRELVVFALDAWSRESDGLLKFSEAGGAASALMRFRWIAPGDGLYGETQRMTVAGRRGAIVNIMPEIAGQGEPLASLARADRLLRDSVVYLTCVHEIGHALGLEHSRNFDDIMYYFGYGGDVVRYFERYRSRLHSRADIRRYSGLSDGDLQAFRALYRN